MRIPRSLMSASVVALATLSDASLSQNLGPPPGDPAAAGARAAAYDPQQFPSIRGEVERMSLTARGDIDGVILKDGTEVQTAPNLSTQMAFAIKPGDRVTIHGLRAAALPLVRAVSITDDVSHRTVSDSDVVASIDSAAERPAPPRGASLPAPGAGSETSGRVRMALHGPQGEVNGVLLESGVILRFPPGQTVQLNSLVQPTQSLVAEGVTVTNALGTVVDVRQMGPSRDRLVAVGTPMPAGPPPAPGAMPPPLPPAR